jgi:hypothetical protein
MLRTKSAEQSAAPDTSQADGRNRPARNSSEDAAPPIEIILNVLNVDTQTWEVELEYEHQTGTRRRSRVPRGDLANPRKLHDFLLNQGAVIPIDPKQGTTVIQNLAPASADHISYVTSQTGWHTQPKLRFVLPLATLGGKGGSQFQWSEEEQSGRGKTRGTLSGWREGLRPALKDSHYLSFALSLAFAAPLAALARVDETAAFHLFGESNTGKTLLERVTVSVLGRTRERDLVNFNQTALGTQDTMANWNGTLLTLNEMETAQTKKYDLNAFMVTLAHVLTSGIGRNRAEYAKRDPLLALKHWTIFGITNMEESLEEMARLANHSRAAGERARYIDIPVPPRRLGGIFDRHRPKDREKIAAWSRALAQATEKTIGDRFGVAFPLFIKYVVKSRKAALRRFNHLANLFVSKVAPNDNWERRFALKFGYAYAGGIIAIDAGVMPCKAIDVRKSVSKLYRKARGAFTADVDLGHPGQ